QERVVRASEARGIESDCEMHFQGISGDFCLRTSREKASTVPQRSVSTRSNWPEVFPRLVREQIQALAGWIIPYNASVRAAFRCVSGGAPHLACLPDLQPADRWISRGTRVEPAALAASRCPRRTADVRGDWGVRARRLGGGPGS